MAGRADSATPEARRLVDCDRVERVEWPDRLRPERDDSVETPPLPPAAPIAPAPPLAPAPLLPFGPPPATVGPTGDPVERAATDAAAPEVAPRGASPQSAQNPSSM